ncbi:MAG: MmgE/PrpD family protein [Hyphomicrobiales bacterium]|nr:MmgE/PrpD family protein [Hyphomicrobiales bacterium]
MPSLTAELGRFVSELTLKQIPAEGLSIAKFGITDCVGVMIAGAREPVSAIIDRELADRGDRGEASLIPSLARRRIEHAALVNGAAAHVLDYDDVTLDGHPSAVLVPTILAQGEATDASGADLLTAYAAGYEVWAELLVREPVPLHQKGWHPTAVRGAVASAAACAKLRCLSPHETQTALAIAASMAGGVVANFGSLTKCYQVGRAAQSGVIAARLAGAGLTASPDALEHNSGFLAAFSPTGHADLQRPLDPGNKEWHLAIRGLNLKRYPNCYATHRAIDAVLKLVDRYDVKPIDVDKVRVSTGETQMLMLRNAQPKTAFEAKFSMQFAMASALVARAVGLEQLTDDFVLHPDVQGLMSRVTIATTKETMNDSAFAPSESVEITTKDGQVRASGPVVHAKGSMQSPLSRSELEQKFVDCLGRDFQADTKYRLFESLMKLESTARLSELLSLIRARHPEHVLGQV